MRQLDPVLLLMRFIWKDAHQAAHTRPGLELWPGSDLKRPFKRAICFALLTHRLQFIKAIHMIFIIFSFIKYPSTGQNIRPNGSSVNGANGLFTKQIELPFGLHSSSKSSALLSFQVEGSKSEIASLNSK